MAELCKIKAAKFDAQGVGLVFNLFKEFRSGA
jgi:hypothetical protein